MRINTKEAIIIGPEKGHVASVIGLHGLGADGHDFEAIVTELQLPDTEQLRFIFPHAPKRPVTINNDMVMRAWYDIKNPDLLQMEDSQSIVASAEILHTHIEREIAQHIDASRIIVAGFSQGGAIALYGGLRYPVPLAGILALSSYLPLPHQLERMDTTVQRNTPIMIMHGAHDPIIPIQHSRASYTRLKQAGYQIEWREYRMQHTICASEIADIGCWLSSRLN